MKQIGSRGMYRTKLTSPLGPLHLASDGERLTGLWIEGQKYFAAGLDKTAIEQPELPAFQQAAAWLDAYFGKRNLPPLPPPAPVGSNFRREVWKRLLEIPYGKTTTYGALAKELKAVGIPASPQAVGGAVGHNPISILIPCHRVVGSSGSLTGYAGGVEKKRFLLELEGAGLSSLYVPKKGTALWGRKEMYHPEEIQGQIAAQPGADTASHPESAPEKFPCPCCGYKTFPVPKERATAYICPVCFWENDVFTSSEDQPSDENRGITLKQGREAFRRLGAIRKDLIQYVRKPFPEEIP